MALNTRQLAFITRMKTAGKMASELYHEAFTLNNSFNEEFNSGSDNDLEVMINELAELGIDYDDIQKFSNQYLASYMDFYNNVTITAKEYGKFVRRIMDIK